jgi:hypothetical protein
MTNDIQRYGVRHEVFKPTPEGEFVSYKDHKRIVAELQETINSLENKSIEQAWRNLVLSHPD